jgi:hypothetical protein
MSADGRGGGAALLRDDLWVYIGDYLPTLAALAYV